MSLAECVPAFRPTLVPNGVSSTSAMPAASGTKSSHSQPTGISEESKSEIKILLARMEALETKLEKLKTASTTGNIPPPLDTDVSPPVLDSPGIEKEKETWTERPFSLETEIIKIKSEDWFLKMDEFGKYLDKATLAVSMATPNTATIPHKPELEKHQAETSSKPSYTDEELASRVPDRLAILDSVLLVEFKEITKPGPSVALSNNAVLRPFKPLILYETEFRQALAKRSKEYKDLLAQKMERDASTPAEQGPESEGSTTEKASERADAKSTLGEANGYKETTNGTEPVPNTVSSTSDPWAEAGQTSEGTKNLDVESLEYKIREAGRLMNGLKCLVHFLHIDLKPIFDMRVAIEAGSLQEIAFEDLWHLYEPGTTVISTDQRQAYCVLNVTGGRPIRFSSSTYNLEKKIATGVPRISDFTLDCMFIDCDGKEYGAVPKVIKISPYQDLRPITLLEVYPLKFSPRLESKLIQRGKKFVKLAGVAHKKYKGLSIKEETVRQEEVYV